ncbi:MAG: SprT family zinc-dependent metalloprotease [Bacteroidales bacterium]
MRIVKRFNISGIGEISLIKRRGYKNIRISVAHTKGVVVTVPYLLSWKSALHFVDKKRGWIEKAIEKERERSKFNLIDVVEGAEVMLIEGSLSFHFIEEGELSLGKRHFRVVVEEEREQPHYIIETLRDGRGEPLFNALFQVLKSAAHSYLPQRVAYLSALHNLHPTELKIRRSKGRWGSCSSNGVLSLNSHLMRLPQELCDFVILHELAHLRHHNHGREFYTLLNSLTRGERKRLDMEIKKYTPKLELRRGGELFTL